MVMNWSASVTGRIYHTGKELLALPFAVVSGSLYGSSWPLQMLPSARHEGRGTLRGRSGDSCDDADAVSWGAWWFLMRICKSLVSGCSPA